MPVRPNPACTSSQISSAPCLCSSASASGRKPAGGIITPWPCTGSMIIAATSPLRSSASRAARSPSGISVPGSSGPKPRLNSSAPFTDSEPAVSPWNP